jgi:hypothetical protein
MPDIHPEDAKDYWASPDTFIIQLYWAIRGEYASLYPDAEKDLPQAKERLTEAVHAGISRRELLQKIRYMMEKTEQRYRAACARVVIDRYWLKKFTSTLVIRPVDTAAPYEGPMPQHP